MSAVRLVGAFLTVAIAAGVSPASAQGICGRPARIEILPRVLRLEVGGEARLAVTAYDERGLPCRPEGTLWESSNRQVATVEAGGVVTAIGNGIAVVSVRVQGARGTTRTAATVFVGAIAVTRPAVPKVFVGPAPVPAPVRTPRRPSLSPQSLAAPTPMPRPRTAAEHEEYLRRLVQRLDSLLFAFSDLFRNVSGLPLFGASEPKVLSSRERGRWTSCAELVAALDSYAPALQESRLTRGRVPPEAAEAQEQLEAALGHRTALGQCRTLADMLAQPDRPNEVWAQRYLTAAVAFYGGWFAEVRALQEVTRMLGRAVSASFPPALSPEPPYEVSIHRFFDLRQGVRPGPRRGAVDPALLAAADSAGARMVAAGEMVVAALEDGDVVLESGSRADLYAVEARAGQTLWIELRSQAFDAYVQVVAPEGVVLAEDDDGLGQGTDSRALFVAPRDGRFWIVVSAFSARRSLGRYTLSVR